MSTFREYLKEGYGSGDSVLPLRGMVKGNTVEKSAASAVEFFGSNMGAVVVANREGKNYALYTSGTGERMARHYVKNDNKVYLIHDQTGRPIGEGFTVIGWFNMDDTGVSRTGGSVKPNTKLAGSYTYK